MLTLGSLYNVEETEIKNWTELSCIWDSIQNIIQMLSLLKMLTFWTVFAVSNKQRNDKWNTKRVISDQHKESNVNEMKKEQYPIVMTGRSVMMGIKWIQEVK